MAIIRIDQAALRRMLNSPTDIVGRDLQRRANAAAAETRRLAPGSVPSQIVGPQIGHRGNELSATIESRHPATLYLVNGTRPHLIRPRTRQALRFTVGGRVVFAKLVRHPGTSPNDYMNKGLLKAL